jgi:hypothetical protein
MNGSERWWPLLFSAFFVITKHRRNLPDTIRV